MPPGLRERKKNAALAVLKTISIVIKSQLSTR